MADNSGFLDTSQLKTIGSGIQYPEPFSLDTGGMQTSSGESRINQSIYIILSTPKGTRLFNPEFGSDILKAIFENFIDFNLIAYYVTEAISLWEKRITVTNVQSVQDPYNPHKVNVNVYYNINATNLSSNYVYPFFTTPYLPGFNSVEGY